MGIMMKSMNQMVATCLLIGLCFATIPERCNVEVTRMFSSNGIEQQKILKTIADVTVIGHRIVVNNCNLHIKMPEKFISIRNLNDFEVEHGETDNCPDYYYMVGDTSQVDSCTFFAFGDHSSGANTAKFKRQCPRLCKTIDHLHRRKREYEQKRRNLENALQMIHQRR